MRVPLIPLIVVLLLSIVADVYIYLAARKRCGSGVPSKLQLFSAIALYILLIVGLALPRRGDDNGDLLTVMWLLFTFATTFLPKVLFLAIDLIASTPLLIGCKRLSWLSITGGIAAVVLFIAMWWGAAVNRFRVQVREIEVAVARLSKEFDGYRIVQFSDLHTGTFGRNNEFVGYLVDKINELDGDLVVFTGDIVNRRTDEIEPHWSTLSRLYAPDGVYAILGNHDYGDYCDWPNDALKGDNMVALHDYFNLMGWRLLCNEHVFIHSGADSLALIGVENVGDPPFKNYGSLENAYPNLSDKVTKILLSHNPAHWVDDIADNDSIDIALTLSGHTHAMQIEMLGMSPAKFRYDTWGGLYKDGSGNHKLYVNIGSGTVGMPMRLGATPEITVITLRQE